MTAPGEKIIPDSFIPQTGARVETIEGKDYLIANDAMYTFYRRTKGEFSPFFLAIRDEKKILGCRCDRCGLVRVPPFLTHCPDCEFAATELVEVGQTGAVLSTPPITYFATALFQHMAPYGRGRVVLDGADTALSINLYTTTGILVPGILKKNTRVKLVFRDVRIGEMTDVFAVPADELSIEQQNTKGLSESDVDWESPKAPELPEPTAEERRLYNEAFAELKAIVAEMNASPRARKDISGWKRTIAVKARGGEFTLFLDDGDIRVDDGPAEHFDFVLVSRDLQTLLDGLAYRGAITDAVIDRKLWISKNTEFNTVFKLDRMARSLARDRKIG